MGNYFLTFPAYRGLLYFLDPCSFLDLQTSSSFSLSSLLALVVTFHTDTDMFSFYNDHCNYTGATCTAGYQTSYSRNEFSRHGEIHSPDVILTETLARLESGRHQRLVVAECSFCEENRLATVGLIAGDERPGGSRGDSSLPNPQTYYPCPCPRRPGPFPVPEAP